MSNEKGFTLIELLAGILIASLLMGLGALALRNYWFVQSLRRSRAEVVTQMRSAQQKAMAESHPLVYGVWFEPGESGWGVVKYDPTDGGSCEVVDQYDFGGGVESALPANVTERFVVDSGVQSQCNPVVPGTGERFAFFYPRGSATAGKIRLTSVHLDNEYVVEVKGVTGRVVTQ